MSTELDPIVAKFYTNGRKFPILFGRLPDGTQILGGPYSIGQVVVGAIVIFVAFQTSHMWGTGVGIIDLVLSAAIGWLATFVMTLLPKTRRNAMSLTASALSALSAPGMGRVRGVAVRWKVARRVRSRVVIDFGRSEVRPGREVVEEVPVESPVEVEGTREVAPVEAELPVLRSGRAVSGVERLLGQAGAR